MTASSGVTVRLATHGDLEEIAAVHVDSIVTLGARAYGSGIVATWGAPRDGTRYARAMAGGERLFVAVRKTLEGDEQILGFSGWRVAKGQHRTSVYVAGRAARQGVGSALFRAAEDAARAAGASEIHVDASLAATAFYEANGFEIVAPGEHRLSDGTLMPCVFMRKQL